MMDLLISWSLTSAIISRSSDAKVWADGTPIIQSSGVALTVESLRNPMILKWIISYPKLLIAINILLTFISSQSRVLLDIQVLLWTPLFIFIWWCFMTQVGVVRLAKYWATQTAWLLWLRWEIPVLDTAYVQLSVKSWLYQIIAFLISYTRLLSQWTYN